MTVPCEPGSWAVAGSPLCSRCAAGRFQNFARQGTCMSCPPGTACAGIGSATATPCSPGTFARGDGSTACTGCARGLYQDATAATACHECDPGHWCSTASRVPCSENTFNPHPLAHVITNCTRCPERTTTRGMVGSTASGDCRCVDDFYLAPVEHAAQRNLRHVDSCMEQCCRCPPGSTCNASEVNASHTTTLATLPIKRGHYRRVNSTVDVRRCPDAAENCSGASECAHSTSGCRGGSDYEKICMPGLHGICELLPPAHL